MRSPKDRIETYYALFLPGDKPGTGSFAEVEPDEEVNVLGRINERICAVYLFSTKKKAADFSRIMLGAEWNVMPMPFDFCEKFLVEAKGFGKTHVALDPGGVMLTTQPIDLFIKAMPFRKLEDS